MGILERIEGKLDTLISCLPVSNMSEFVQGTLEEFQHSSEIIKKTVETEERDNGGKGVTWDARIHTSNKGRTQKDVWKRKPGLENDFFDSVMAELQNDGGVKALPEKKTPPKKTLPNKKAPPKKPAQKKGDDQKFKPKALQNINEICKVYGASIETVIGNLLEEHGIDTFDSLPDNLHEEVYEKSHAWLKSLKEVQEEIDTLTKMSEGSEHSGDIDDAIKVFIQEAGASDSLLGSVPVDSLDNLKSELIAYSDQWAEFFSE